MENILTFDIEDWYHSNLEGIDSSKWATYESRVQEPTRRILRLLRETKNSATFFVLGCVAERFPQLVREIRDGGHEIASHGYGHKLVYEQTPEQFVEDVSKSKIILENIVEERIIGYRAPSWSASASGTPWVWAALNEMGFVYDSSLFPFKTYLYGDSTSNPHFHEINSRNGKTIFEVPPSILQFGSIRFPFSGGFYLRLLPLAFIRFAIRRLNRSRHPSVLYLHPREIDNGQPRLDLKFKERFIQYYNIENAEKKLVALLNRYKFTSIKARYI